MKLVYLDRKNEVGQIESFFFKSDDLKSWQAGQYINLTMSDVPPAIADRLFSIASAPFEDVIRITTVIGPSDFKQRMAKLKAGEIVEADQLGGDFVWQDEPTKKLFIAGGIGISAFRPIILERAHKGLTLNTRLLYAGKPERRPFISEIQKVANQDDTFKVTDFINDRLTIDSLIKAVPDYEGRLIYLAGSQEFVEGLGEGLMARGLPRERIKYDWFDNYKGV